ncbi:MAG: endo-1,4-beta-xylanase [Turicibacter sp.]|nr:endo-1,4-beta-xylanase [Turicibacter sp.]
MTKWNLELPALHKCFADKFMFGNIISPQDFDDHEALAMMIHHYNAVTAENAVNPFYISTNRKELDFTQSDKIVNWANQNEIAMIGHTLIGHSQSTNWLNSDTDGNPLTRVEALANMEWFIKAYVGRYKGKMHSWDVVNEAIRDDAEFSGDWRNHLRSDSSTPEVANPFVTWSENLTGDSNWYLAFENGADKQNEESGSDYIFYAYKFARLYDPQAKLYYNDYNEESPVKREVIAQMVEEINLQWRIDSDYDGSLLIEGIGMQGHYHGYTNLAQVRESLERFIATGVDISITELDVRFSTPNEALNSLSVGLEEKQARFYKRLFTIYNEFSENIERITLWGVNDKRNWHSWGWLV